MKRETTITKSMMVIAWVLALGTMAPMLDTTMINIAVNRLAADFHTTLSMVQWTITGFTLMMGIVVPISGWLLNRFSGRDVYIWAEVIFGLTSMLVGLSPNINVLIGLRLLQGASASLILTLMTTLLIDTVGSDKIGRIMAIVGVPMTLGPMIGPILGGIIVRYLSWRWIFFVNVPVALLAVWALIRFVPRGQAKNLQA